jgi:hypothetical protein
MRSTKSCICLGTTREIRTWLKERINLNIKYTIKDLHMQKK